MWQGLQGDNLQRLSTLTVRLIEKLAQERLEDATIQLGPECRDQLCALKGRVSSEQRLIPRKSPVFKFVKVISNASNEF
jgi:hypothetical protein